MPIYQDIRTFECGFFNNRIINGVNDREYKASDMNKPYDRLVGNGVCPNPNGTISTDLQVVYESGMKIYVDVGRGIFNGHWFDNLDKYRITLDIGGISSRYDCVIVVVDDSKNVRDVYLQIKSLDHVPTVNDLVRNNVKYEYCLGYVSIGVGMSDISTQANIIDTRGNASLCGFITGLFNQFDTAAVASQQDAAFNQWWREIKDTIVSNATLIRYYSSQYATSVANEDTIPIQIPQYDKNLDSLIVYVNGLVLNPTSGYTITSNEFVTLNIPLPVIGTIVMFEVFKSINGSQANTVVTEVGVLQEQVAELEKSGKYQYNCNSVNDNAKLSDLVTAFLEADANNTDYGSYTIYVNGKFGYTSPISGDGSSSSSAYRIMQVGLGSARNRKVILDFSNCSFIDLTFTDTSKYYVIMYGMNANIKNLNLRVTANNSFVSVFSTPTNVVVNAEDCRFWISGNQSTVIARSGTFKNCRVSMTNINGDSYCFNVGNESLLRVIGGEYYSYTGSSSYSSAVIYVSSSNTSAVVITYGLNLPTVTRSGYTQTYAINCLSNNAKCSFTDTITTLTINATGQNIRGTIAESKAGMM